MNEKITINMIETLETIYPRGYDVAVAGEGSLTLAKALYGYIDRNPLIKAAQLSAAAAGSLGIATVRKLNAYLEDNDFDSEILVGEKFIKPLINPCPQLEESIKENGAAATARVLSQGVIRVNSLIIDILYRKLGERYSTVNNFPMIELKHYWERVKDVKALTEITPEAIREMLGKPPKVPQVAPKATFIHQNGAPKPIVIKPDLLANKKKEPGLIFL